MKLIYSAFAHSAVLSAIAVCAFEASTASASMYSYIYKHQYKIPTETGGEDWYPIGGGTDGLQYCLDIHSPSVSVGSDDFPDKRKKDRLDLTANGNGGELAGTFMVTVDWLGEIDISQYNERIKKDSSYGRKGMACHARCGNSELIGYDDKGSYKFDLYEVDTCDTEAPTFTPSSAPSHPTTSPTESPTKTPTAGPTAYPTEGPTAGPTKSPTGGPTASPTVSPTSTPIDEAWVTDLMNNAFMPLVEESFAAKLTSLNIAENALFINTIYDVADSTTATLHHLDKQLTVEYKGDVTMSAVTNLDTLRGDSMEVDTTLSGGTGVTITESTDKTEWHAYYLVKGGYDSPIYIDASIVGSFSISGAGLTIDATTSSQIAMANSAMQGIVEVSGYTDTTNGVIGYSNMTDCTLHTFEFDAIDADITFGVDSDAVSFEFSTDVVDDIDGWFNSLSSILIYFLQLEVDADLPYIVS